MSNINSSDARRPISKTALRLVGVFGAIFALFGMALAVTLVALNEIAEMESQVVKID
jgi:two-component system, NtrC family, sensor kinase